VKIIVDGRARYPDAMVVRRPDSPAATVASDPVIVFEVLSEGSTQTDLIDKNREHRATQSTKRYVVLQQTHKAAIIFARRENSGCRRAFRMRTEAGISWRSGSPCPCGTCKRMRDCRK
jgi:Uma2 family endonuclease